MEIWGPSHKKLRKDSDQIDFDLPIDKNDLSILMEQLPHNHLFSLILESQLEELLLEPPTSLLNANIQSKGLIRVEVSAGRLDGFGAHPWAFLIGGAGIGSETTGAGAVVGVRVATPISHVIVNDIGFVSEKFWSTLSPTPTLRCIVEQCSKILESPIEKESDSRSAMNLWTTAEEYTFKKFQCIQQYKNFCRFPHFIQLSQQPTAWDSDWLHPQFRQIAARCKHDPRCWREILTEESPGIFSFDFLSHSFCDMLIAEIDNFDTSSLPKRRPNTMNKYGLILAEIGMYGLVSTLLEQWLAPLAKVLYPEEPVAYGLDHHHSFFVQYNPHGGDLGLDMHHDRQVILVILLVDA